MARPWYIYFWTFPTTAPGLLVAAFSPDWEVHDGVLEVSGGLATFILERCTPLEGGASAMTLGHVVLGRDPFCLSATRLHERIHVRQAERWGPLFLPAYGFASLYMLVKGKRPYLDNPFEVEAYADDERRRSARQ